MLRGLTTVNFFADDLRGRGDWYTELLGVEPYFVKPSIEEPRPTSSSGSATTRTSSGIIDRRFTPGGQAGGPRRRSPTGPSTTCRRPTTGCSRSGATAPRAPTERGPGFVTASVVDPFGNVLGVMYNQHYLEMLG